MSWTAPRTWVTGEVVTASIMNAHVRDNLLTVPAVIADDPNVTTAFASGTLATGFNHLLAIWRFTSSRAAVEDDAYVRFNGSSADYNYGYTQTLNTTVTGDSQVGATLALVGTTPGTHASVVSVLPGAGILFVPDHRAGGGKTILGLSHSYYGNTTASHRLRFIAGGWQNNAAITSVALGVANGNASGRATIYGLPVLTP